MDTSPDVLADSVRAKRNAVDNDLELLRVRVQQLDPRQVAARRWAATALPVAGAAAVWMWSRRRRAVDSLEDLLAHMLSDLHRAEHVLLAALQEMSAAASNPDLARAFERHRGESETHIDRLERVFRSIERKPGRARGSAVEAVVEEAQKLLARERDPDVRDAWLIAAAQRAEHLEIADYGTARTFAQTLGYTHAAQLLQQTLEEERAMDEQLTALAERFVNPQSIR